MLQELSSTIHISGPDTSFYMCGDTYIPIQHEFATIYFRLA